MTRERDFRARARDLPSGPFRLTFSDADDGPLLLEQTFEQTRMAMCVTDPNLDDNPIVYVNSAFLKLTGYEEEDVVGRNCRLLQGPQTDENSVQRLRDALRSENVCIVELLNYRKNGDAFWNALHIGPIYDQHGKLRYFFGSQWDVTDVHAARVMDQQARTINRELNHRIKNLFAVMASIVSLSAQEAETPDEAAQRARDRIVALGRAHEATIDPRPGVSVVMLRTMLNEVLAPFTRSIERRVEIDGPDVALQISAVTPLGLILHELTVNSLKHGTLGEHGDALTISWDRSQMDLLGEERDVLRLVWREDGLNGTQSETAVGHGVGARIVKAMAQSFAGTIDMVRDGDAFEAIVVLPADTVLFALEDVDGHSGAGVADPA